MTDGLKKAFFRRSLLSTSMAGCNVWIGYFCVAYKSCFCVFSLVNLGVDKGYGSVVFIVPFPGSINLVSVQKGGF